jgi:hypothetical protein
VKTEHWNLLIPFYLGGEGAERESDGEDEPNQVVLQVGKEMSQWTPLYNYYMLIKMF